MGDKRKCSKYESYQLVEVDNQQNPKTCWPRTSSNYKGSGGVFQGPLQAAAKQAFKRLIRKNEIHNKGPFWLRKRDRQETQACISKVRVSRQPMLPGADNKDEVAKCIRDAAQCHTYNVKVLKLNKVVKSVNIQPLNSLMPSNARSKKNTVAEQARLLSRLPSLEVPANNRQLVVHANYATGASAKSQSSANNSPVLLNTSRVHHFAERPTLLH